MNLIKFSYRASKWSVVSVSSSPAAEGRDSDVLMSNYTSEEKLTKITRDKY